MKISLYEIDKMYEETILLSIDEEGEIADEFLFELLDDLEIAKKEKALNIAAMIKNRLAFGEAIKAEKLALEARQKQANNEAEKLRKYLERCLQEGDKYEDARSCIRWTTSSFVQITDEDQIPDDLMKTTKAPKKKEIKAYILGGDVCPGAEYIKGHKKLQVK